MSRELRIDVGVIAEKRKARSEWAEDYWVPTAIIEGHVHHKPGEMMRQTETGTMYFMGFSEIYCHAKEAEAYVHNFESEIPAIYIILRPDDEDEHPLPWYVHTVTVSPYEAQDFADSSEEIIERVAMPMSIATALMDFTDTHHEDVPFKKRKRQNFKEEKLIFGKEPVFTSTETENNHNATQRLKARQTTLIKKNGKLND